MSGFLIQPIVQPDRWIWFAAALVVGTALTVAFSPRRRAALGLVRLTAGRVSQLAVPLAGVFVVRSGFRHAYVADGRSWWDAMWMSLAWMAAFIFVGRLFVRTVPPTSWLLRDLRQAGRDVWKERLGRWMGRTR